MNEESSAPHMGDSPQASEDSPTGHTNDTQHARGSLESLLDILARAPSEHTADSPANTQPFPSTGALYLTNILLTTDRWESLREGSAWLPPSHLASENANLHLVADVLSKIIDLPISHSIDISSSVDTSEGYIDSLVNKLDLPAEVVLRLVDLHGSRVVPEASENDSNMDRPYSVNSADDGFPERPPAALTEPRDHAAASIDPAEEKELGGHTEREPPMAGAGSHGEAPVAFEQTGVGGVDRTTTPVTTVELSPPSDTLDRSTSKFDELSGTSGPQASVEGQSTLAGAGSSQEPLAQPPTRSGDATADNPPDRELMDNVPQPDSTSSQPLDGGDRQPDLPDDDKGQSTAESIDDGIDTPRNGLSCPSDRPVAYSDENNPTSAESRSNQGTEINNEEPGSTKELEASNRLASTTGIHAIPDLLTQSSTTQNEGGARHADDTPDILSPFDRQDLLEVLKTAQPSISLSSAHCDAQKPVSLPSRLEYEPSHALSPDLAPPNHREETTSDDYSHNVSQAALLDHIPHD